jgi:hypothetical protein
MNTEILEKGIIKFPHELYDEHVNPAEIDYKSLIVPFSKFKNRLEKKYSKKNKENERILQKNYLVAELETS